MTAQASLSLERKLPLLISVLLLALTVGLTWAGYTEVRQSAEMRGIDRMQRIAAQFAEVASLAINQRLATVQRVASDRAIVARLTNPGADTSSEGAVAVALRGLSATPADTPVVAELRSVGEARRLATSTEIAGDEEPAAKLVRRIAQGRPGIGEIYGRGDSSFYWVGAPVAGNGRVLGYLLQRRTIAAGARLERQIRELVGSDSVSVYFATDSGAVWASLGGRTVSIPSTMVASDEAPNVVRYAHGSGRRYVAVYTRVPNTPFRVIAETPYESLLARPTAFLRRSIMVGLVMLIIGFVAAWLLSRRITKPLRDLTAAADAISTGDYARRARVVGGDETGRLAEAFNTMAEQVQRSHDDLARQNEAARTLAARLEEANRAKASFLATMSHELRTPLNAIGGYVDLLELGVRGPITAEQRHDLERVRYNQRHLLALIGNILDFTRLDAQKLTYDIADVRVDQVVTEVLNAVSPLLDEKRLTRKCSGCSAPVFARADRARLEQILLNLLSNSVRFTPTGGHVAVSIEEGDGQVAVTVADTGIGIPPDKLTVIFEPFVQLDSGLTRTVGGTGLGLTISRELARAMGGDLTAEANPGGGARFTLTLPSVRTGQGRGDSERLPLAAVPASTRTV